MDKFNSIIKKAWGVHNSLLCVGIDPVLSKLPKHLLEVDDTVFTFAKEIIDATHEYVCAYKPNSAFFEALGRDGIRQLRMICDYINVEYPDLLLILDAKRGDIGSSNEAYAQYAFDYLGVDAVTLHPYLGKEANAPFLNRTDKGCIFLCKTSNPGSGEFQNIPVDRAGKTFLYQHVAKQICSEWNDHENCMLVVGATYPEELKEVRDIVGDIPILVPGIGLQGGDLEKTLSAGLTSSKKGLIITVSRSIIYAGSGEDFAQKSREEAKKIYSHITKFTT
ncbi:orotidine-5'-phosphate decarboxylase [Candidatus Woesebacteria bacterium]|nr:orotidine-5'-phosphate decarboxylase [Candidatus Woesebacteria bacterium]